VGSISNGDEALFSVTLTEVAFLLFFLVVFLSAFKLTEKEEIIRNKSIAEAELKKELTESKNALDEAVSKLSVINAKLGGLMNLPKEELSDAVSELVKADENNIKLEKELRDLKRTLEHAKEMLEKEKDKHRNLLGQFKNLESRFLGNGLDHPACWANAKTGKLEYLFEIKIQKDGFFITSVWPEYRKKGINYFDTTQYDSPHQISVDNFKSLSQKVFDWSANQKPECRHFVRVKDSKNTTKAEYKEKLRIIEEFYYKLILGN